MDTAGKLFEVAKKLYDTVQQAKHNKKQCTRLGERVEQIKNQIVQLGKIKDYRNHVQVNMFIECVEECTNFVSMASDLGWIKRHWYASSHGKEFVELNKRLCTISIDLNLGLNLKQIFDREQDRRDAAEDAHQIQQNFRHLEDVFQKNHNHIDSKVQKNNELSQQILTEMQRLNNNTTGGTSQSRMDLNDPVVAKIRGFVAKLYDHDSDADSQAVVCRGLSGICYNSAVNQAHAGAADAIHALVVVMQLHHDSSAVIAWACTALRWITENAVNQSKAAQPEVVQAVVLAMNPNSPIHEMKDEACAVLQKRICRILASIICNPNIRKTAACRDAIHAIVAAIRESPGIEAMAFAALEKICLDDSDNQRLAIQVGAVEAISTAMRQLATDDEVQFNGTAALKVLRSSTTLSRERDHTAARPYKSSQTKISSFKPAMFTTPAANPYFVAR